MTNFLQNWGCRRAKAKVKVGKIEVYRRTCFRAKKQNCLILSFAQMKTNRLQGSGKIRDYFLDSANTVHFFSVISIELTNNAITGISWSG